MGIIELLKRIGEENCNVQSIPKNFVKSRLVDNQAELTMVTAPENVPNFLGISEKMGVVIWVDMDVFNTAMEQANQPARQGGFYIRDLRSPIGNCMKFWYKAGYGTKHSNFFWCATLEEAKEYKGGADWFEIWDAPYIDSLIEHTVDFQLADPSVGLVNLDDKEQKND